MVPMLERITPVLLTHNEEPNIDDTLRRLAWARDVVVVDSGSTDQTLAILERFSNVRYFIRKFDTHANQWRYATDETKIKTDWILRLDADYKVLNGLVAELARLNLDTDINAYRVAFKYSIFSRTLYSSLYPANTVLLRKGCFRVLDKGHTEAWEVTGPIGSLRQKIVHDDRKPSEHWISSQVRYMRRELSWLQSRRSGLVRWLRLRPPLMPIAVFFYCLICKGLIFNGRAGLFYAMQRMVAEGILSIMVLEGELREQTKGSEGWRSDDFDATIS